MFESRNPTAFPVLPYIRLTGATLLSLLLHALALGIAGWWLSLRPPPPSSPEPLEVSLAPLEAPPPALLPPEPSEPEPPAQTAPAPTELKPLPPPPPPSKAPTPAPTAAAAEITRAASRQVVQHLFYPPAAIAQGQQGEAMVMLFLDANGNAMAARLEHSSGYPLLDDAAVQAALAVRSMPDGAPREIRLPVRFRLN